MTYKLSIFVKRHRKPFVQTIVDESEMHSISSIVDDKDAMFLNLGTVIINKDMITYIRVDHIEAKL